MALFVANIIYHLFCPNLALILSKYNLSMINGRILANLKSFIISPKVFKSIVCDTIHDFQKKWFCLSCRLDIFDHISMHKRDKFSLSVAYFDFSKTYGKVSHNMLLAMLSVNEIDHELISWISSSLNNQTQVIKIQELLSLPKLIISGVV